MTQISFGEHVEVVFEHNHALAGVDKAVQDHAFTSSPTFEFGHRLDAM